MKYFTLKNQNKIPAIGLGTWHLVGDTCQKAVETALEAGYRHIDTAEIYGNQQEIGDALSKSSIDRKKVFLTSKVWRSNLTKDKTIDSAKNTLEALKTNYLDLLLIHWPNDEIPLFETLEALKLLKSEGLIKNYGVSNFSIKNLKKTKGFDVVINQVEFHPSLNQKKLKNYCNKNNIIITAYSPLGQGKDLKFKEVKDLAKKYGVSSSQVIINWLISKGIVAIPRSGDKKHIKDNFKAIDWELDQKDIKLLDGLNKDNRLVNPDFSDF